MIAVRALPSLEIKFLSRQGKFRASTRFSGARIRDYGITTSASRRDPILIKALRAAHAMLSINSTGLPTLAAAPASPYCRRLIRLAFLAPDLQCAILAGEQPPGLTLESVMHAPMPALWSEQAAMIESLAMTGAPAAGARRSG